MSERARARVCVEPPPGWGMRMMLARSLEKLGYSVAITGAGDRWILVLS